MKTKQTISVKKPSNVLSKSISQSTFKKRCEAADALLRYNSSDVMFYKDRSLSAGCFEDDGNLHIHRSDGLHATFDVGNGQYLSGREQNEQTKLVMEFLGLPITDRVLIKETDEDEDNCCPTCGRAGYR